MRKIAAVVFASSIGALALAGCAAPAPYDEAHEGELTDDDPKIDQDESRYDDYPFEADEGWTITVEMTSSEFDTYLWLIGPNNSSLVQVDDIAAGNHDSRIVYTAPARGMYTVRANSYDGQGRGAYRLTITAGPGEG